VNTERNAMPSLGSALDDDDDAVSLTHEPIKDKST